MWNWKRLLGVGLALGLGITVSSGEMAAAQPRDIPREIIDVDGQEIPVVGDFVYSQFRDPLNPEIRGLVHGARRIEGGTVLYYSLGVSSKESDTFTGNMAFPNQTRKYKISAAADIQLFDIPELTGYSPLMDGETTFTTWAPDMKGSTGKLYVGWALFPELPEKTDVITVMMPWGTIAGEIPVLDGLLEPVSDELAPVLGKGWPEIPKKAKFAGADVNYSTWDLVQRSGDLEGISQVDESTSEVFVTLDAGVLFAKESAELTPESISTLTSVAADIKARGSGEVKIVGHTDSDGPDSENQVLSEQRAAAVQAQLATGSGTAVTFASEGRGESEPVASNSTPEGQQENRRVTVQYTVKGA